MKCAELIDEAPEIFGEEQIDLHTGAIRLPGGLLGFEKVTDYVLLGNPEEAPFETIGAYQSRLNFTSEELVISKENLSAASSRIQDTDVAEEATQYARYNILVQSGTAMLAQANQLPQSVLRLLH